MTREFILNTLLPYKEDSSTCAINQFGNCMYLDDKGRKCAVGKHMKTGPWQLIENKNIRDLHENDYKLEDMLTNEALDQNIPINIWSGMQNYHDHIANASWVFTKNSTVCHLEEETGFKFPELYFNE